MTLDAVSGIKNNVYSVPKYKKVFHDDSLFEQKISPVDKFENRNRPSESTEDILNELKREKESQGIIGKVWDGFKNLTGIGAGSKKVEKAISDYKEGKISQKDLTKSLNSYKEGQKQSVDIVADIISGITSFAAFSLATGVGIAAAPFTGGASLGLVAAGLGLAGGVGSLTKVAVKGVDSLIGGRKYDSFGYDLATGGVNGIFAPFTAGIGGAAGKAVATRVGVSAMREGGEIVLKNGLKETVKGSLAKTLLTTNMTYTGGTLGARALAIGTDLAVNGAVSGAADSGVRYVAGDAENKSLEGFTKEVAQGTIGGLILSPIIGGGMRYAGNKIGSKTAKLESKVANNYNAAKEAVNNVQTVASPDMEVLKGLGGVIKDADSFVSDMKINGKDFLNGIDMDVNKIYNAWSSILDDSKSINNIVKTASNENKTTLNKILEDYAAGKDVSETLKYFANKGIKLSDNIDERIAKATKGFDVKIDKMASKTAPSSKKVSEGINFVKEEYEGALKILQDAINQIEKIPETTTYQQLGDLPKRTANTYNRIKTNNAQIKSLLVSAQEKLKAGNISGAIDDIKNYHSSLDMLNKNMEQEISSIHNTVERSGLSESADVLKERLSKLTNSREFQNMTKEEQVQAIVENSNILFAKFAQTFSSNDSLPSEVASVLKKFTSNCTTSRNIQQAQQLADELYGSGKYKLVKSFGAGTIGETYLAKTQDGNEFVIKMLKEGINPKRFEEDKALFIKYINEFVTDPAQKEYKLGLISSLFDSWDKELNFAIEAQGAKNMAQNAKRFSVAQTLEVGTKNGQNISLVMEKANGVRLDNLLEMIHLYKNNPKSYFEKYGNLIEEYPALKNPDSWMKDLGAAYQKAQNEQSLFIGKNGTRTVHADPHPGNIFVDFDKQTAKPKIVYIDTGNVIERTNAQTLADIGLSVNMMIGNSKGIAKSMLDGAILPSNSNPVQIEKQFAQMLDERLYKAGISVKNTKTTQNIISGIMKDLNIVPNPNNSNLMKAALQRVETSRAINTLCGDPASLKINLKDLASGLWKAFKAHPSDTWAALKPILKWSYNNDDQAMQTFFQMAIKENPKAI